MNIKIYYPQKFEGFKVQEDMKCRSVILHILERLDIPLIYCRCFGIFRKREMKLELVSYRFKVSEWYDPKARYELLIGALPFNVRVDDLNLNFQEYAFTQINSSIINEQWSLKPELHEWCFNVASYHCAIDFGQFNPEKHKQGFLKNTIQHLVPPSILRKHSYKYAEERIFDNWEIQTKESLNQERSLCILNYLGACEEFVPQFGCFVVNAIYNDTVPVKFGIRQNGLYICRPDGTPVFEGRFHQLTLNGSEDKTSVQINSRGLQYNFHVTSFHDVVKLCMFIERCVYPQEGYFDKDVEAMQKAINERKAQIEQNFEKTLSTKQVQVKNQNITQQQEQHEEDFGQTNVQLDQSNIITQLKENKKEAHLKNENSNKEPQETTDVQIDEIQIQGEIEAPNLNLEAKE